MTAKLHIESVPSNTYFDYDEYIDPGRVPKLRKASLGAEGRVIGLLITAAINAKMPACEIPSEKLLAAALLIFEKDELKLKTANQVSDMIASKIAKPAAPLREEDLDEKIDLLTKLINDSNYIQAKVRPETVKSFYTQENGFNKKSLEHDIATLESIKTSTDPDLTYKEYKGLSVSLLLGLYPPGTKLTISSARAEQSAKHLKVSGHRTAVVIGTGAHEDGSCNTDKFRTLQVHVIANDHDDQRGVRDDGYIIPISGSKPKNTRKPRVFHVIPSNIISIDGSQ